MVIKTNTKEIKEESAPEGYKFIVDAEGRMSLKKIRNREIKVEEVHEEKIVIKKSKKRSN